MFYIVYKITNLINNKIYIGSHKTNDLNDNYMGSGKLIKQAVEKYGFNNFKKEILFIYNNPKQMYLKEAEIVDEEFLKRTDVYNLVPGGHGGWDYINSNKLNYRSENWLEARKKSGPKISKALKAFHIFKNIKIPEL